jgi:N-succinyl-L-ornithine transcarbamylase
MKLTNDAKFMHCLPVRRNMIVSDEVIDLTQLWLNKPIIEPLAQLVLQNIKKIRHWDAKVLRH